MKHLKLFENFNEDIDSICKKYGIENYIINEDGSIDVEGDVNLSYEELTELPLKFRNVSGNFYCYRNQLRSLEGCPKRVGGNFLCHINQLSSLEGCPENVGGHFNCGSNQLTSLEGCPKSIDGNLYCYSNKIISFEGLPYSIGGDFICDGNPIFNIWKLFKDYSKIELFNDYDIIRGTDIVLYRLNSFLDEIGKDPVEEVEGYNTI